jgi:hypothetical protein
MTFGIEIVGALLALSTGSTLWAISASYSARKAQASHSPRPSTKESVRAAVAQQRALPRLRKVLPGQIAERVVANIRVGGLNAYAMIPHDLDAEITNWCRENNVECPPIHTMRTAVASIPGVRSRRVRLNKSSPEHAYIRERQSVHGITNEYPTVYWIDDLPDTKQDTEQNTRVTRVRSVSDKRSSTDRTEPLTARSGKSHRPGQCPGQRPTVRPSGDEWGVAA